jgi:hypothetical protein
LSTLEIGSLFGFVGNKYFQCLYERIVIMDRRSSSDGERTISDSKNVGSSDRFERKRKRKEGTTSIGCGSGPARKHHLRFTGTATIHFGFNITTESLSKESEQQQDETQPDKAHDQAGPSQQSREVRLFGVNIADGLGRQQQEASSSRQAELDLEQRLGQQQGQEATILAQQTEVSQASSSRQQFGWQGQEAFHLAQSHQEIGPSSQPKEISEQMPLEFPSDSDNESSHGRPLVLREPRHEMYHQAHDDGTTSSASRPERSREELQEIAKALIEAKSYKNLPQEMKEKIKHQPFSDYEYQSIWEKVQSQLPNDKERKNMQVILYCKSDVGKAARREYEQSDAGKAVIRKYAQSDAGKASKRKYAQSDVGKASKRKYEQSDAGKAVIRKYAQSDARKVSKRKYDQSDAGKAARRRYLEKKNQRENSASHLELTWNERN